jgi:NAD(P)-dependent dehydrogenase (short-subunit alcohol dehydrogenase family)
MIKSYKEIFDLKHKTAVVTGAAGFLGEKFCNSLSQFGAKVAVVDINFESAKEVSKKINIEGGISEAFQCDVSSQSSVDELIKNIILKFDKIDILHNNAAGKTNELAAFFETFEQYSLDTWDKVMSTNLTGMFLISQAVSKHMIERKIKGSIIQTSSIYGILGPDQRIYEGSLYLGQKINTPAVYSASKAGVVGLTKYLATYLAKYGIRVNTLTPGGVQSGQNQQFIKNYSNRIPLERMAEPDEMVGALIYLASDASSYVTGHNLVVDGGLECW